LPAAAREARFFVAGLFGGAVRRERDLDAMFPPTRRGQHAMACHRESRGAGYFHTGTDLRLIRGSSF
jgi:hypothetical protein